MSKGLNRVMIIGQLGRDPEMRYTPSGKAVTAFSVAVQQSWVSSDGEPQDTVEWFHVVAWGALAETCKKRLSRGSTVYVEGHLQTRSWEGEEREPRYRTELVANQVIVLGP